VEGNLLTEWCRLWVASLVDAGISDFVVCPGSRSTPVVVAIEQQAGVRIHVNIDERSAAFFALGQAKRSGRPSAVLCTSGSAVAHFFPAIIEADRTRTPLLLMSADRPSELQGNGAPQTIDQSQLFGNKVRAFIDLGLPEGSALALRGLQRKASQAVLATLFPHGGAVHVNIPARKPLEPVAAVSTEEHALAQAVTELIARGAPRAFASVARVPERATAAVARLASAARRPVLVLGPLAIGEAPSADTLSAFQAASGWPILAELPSQVRSHGLSICSSFDAVLGSVARGAPANAELVPDFAVQIGAPLVSGAWADLLTQHPTLDLVTASAADWSDPTNQARIVVHGDLDVWLTELAARVPRASDTWLSLWAAANARASVATRESLELLSDDSFNEACAVAELGASLKSGDALVLGNSLPVRLADTHIADIPGVICISQRGANGIDGLVSMAAGVASVHAGRTWLVLGDISALHDLSGLGCLTQERLALTVVVLNNRGGRIFETLPISARRPLDAWTTPHRVELDRAGALFGIPSQQVHTARELQRALAESRASHGPVWIEALVDPSGARRAIQLVREQVALALTSLSPARDAGSNS
jgi:2-succinyl-5-enolpyruvyl-6-hydroxy-3-cyclohexene-1-carboxylate synthase